ncbi:GNAT family N-acetyltransferase [Myroides odoratimimus]|uniref:GNAT family N-acetyltransferase n=1 Tax=Myroides odoratimimus TaxID=76832 RepID=UPI0025771E69|nr:GNAT family N-acetyltransferase [Myroides odoratimimus]MDM1521203.1 GNAT family N-acetyltransferase [Myroides odoratimimus]
MFSYQDIALEDIRWKDFIKRSNSKDFHHSAFYHSIDNCNSSRLFVFEKDNYFIALPIVVRGIEGSDFYDFTSVYGYSGPITNMEIVDDKFLNNFKESFVNYCKKENIICGFSRLNPLILNQKTIMSNIGSVIDLNKTVFIDLKESLEEQRKNFRKSLKSELNQLRRKDYVVYEAITKEDIDIFISIYYETMNRVEADKYYYFSSEYFYNFLDNTDFDSKLLLIKKDGEVAAGAIFTFTGEIVQYHLAGTKDKFIKDTPMKLVLDEARILSTSLGYKYLHLGGGVGGHDDDSLFKFKSGFSKNFAQFSIWKSIFNQEVYKELVKNKGLENSDSSYFPLYRL